jgi:very-short-patch-repair endonuclease
MNRGHARELRNNSTRSERWLWQILRRLKAEGLRFRRQQPIGPYIVDFCCPSTKLIVELDGSQHHQPEVATYDEARTRWLEERGYTVLRFANVDVIRQRDVVIDGILAVAKRGAP